ncbi:hypothetical protein VP01_3739g1 [Puccinia sorghi]|uniref:Uncharacterized protein n=1 Tax=Puccinia sorghi TaxID=27349 RepID=A0A0L6UU20_9BASI|nr:hypothetical protein VP01_3739g1 [Puccinia sorghi]
MEYKLPRSEKSVEEFWSLMEEHLSPRERGGRGARWVTATLDLQRSNHQGVGLWTQNGARLNQPQWSHEPSGNLSSSYRVYYHHLNRERPRRLARPIFSTLCFL